MNATMLLFMRGSLANMKFLLVTFGKVSNKRNIVCCKWQLERSKFSETGPRLELKTLKILLQYILYQEILYE